MTDLTLVIGNKNLSSWSLRPWILMKQMGIPFTEVKIRLDHPSTREEIAKHSPSGLVPVLKVGSETVWDSLAIAETLADFYPDKPFWPSEEMAKARARCLSAEMHSGFAQLRGTWPMDIVNEAKKVSVAPGVQKDLKRIHQLWSEARRDYGGDGPFLFGEFSVADAMYAPVVSRLRTFGPVDLFEDMTGYLETMWELPAMKEWREGAAEEAAAGWYKF
ncbi:glutathione S-transferase family protein [Parvularcula sp. ZS-1/3]|uniref:Glutathione S-transferase family protein n=1 Tax=Parvularcula mediterranea TaxID=2732508 RepID=A0A7Y3RP50_9PROT|nr:glutathione S-transferase family protein [Parvularcula mediterranea]NNU17668.1 glutathione S-transferase family protein [Parvularcula mediterranea]